MLTVALGIQLPMGTLLRPAVAGLLCLTYWWLDHRERPPRILEPVGGCGYRLSIV
jgi:hypothetical protein